MFGGLEHVIGIDQMTIEVHERKMGHKNHESAIFRVLTC